MGSRHERGRGEVEPRLDPPTDGRDGEPPDPDADPEQVARAIVLRQLTIAPRSRRQLEEALFKRNVPDAAAAAVLDRFTELHLIDDDAYARAWVRSRRQGKSLARPVLAHELRARGIAEDIAREVLDQVSDDDEEASARELARRKLASTRGLAPDARLRRTVALLARKGYSSGVALQAARAALAAEDALSE